VIKLYKKLHDGRLAYHEAWANDGTITEHWGDVGSKGETRRHRMKTQHEDRELNALLEKVREAGFGEIEDEDHRTLMVEYFVDGMGNERDVEKRHKLQDHLNELLGWTGLGNCDGGSIGSGTMEVCCFVVDFDIAKSLIARGLIGTEFADYLRIYDEDADQ
jgi:hypothetical protein